MYILHFWDLPLFNMPCGIRRSRYLLQWNEMVLYAQLTRYSVHIDRETATRSTGCNQEFAEYFARTGRSSSI